MPGPVRREYSDLVGLTHLHLIHLIHRGASGRMTEQPVDDSLRGQIHQMYRETSGRMTERSVPAASPLPRNRPIGPTLSRLPTPRHSHPHSRLPLPLGRSFFLPVCNNQGCRPHTYKELTTRPFGSPCVYFQARSQVRQHTSSKRPNVMDP